MKKITRRTMVEYAEQEVRNGSIYVWGAQGQRGSRITDEWIKEMETSTATANRAIALLRKNKAKYDPDKIGAFDCSGLIGACLNANGNPGFDDTADGYRNRCVSIDKGELQAGDFVFEWNGKKSVHMGVYTGNGKVIEARGRDFGVVETGLDMRNWRKYGRPDFMYEDEAGTGQATQPTFHYDTVLKRGSRGEDVSILQNNLNTLGYTDKDGKPLETDGEFGGRTEHAVKSFQRDYMGANEADGQVGKKTTKALGGIWEGK